MAYVPIFFASNAIFKTRVSEYCGVPTASISDTHLRSSERRVKIDLLKSDEHYYCSIAYSTLLSDPVYSIDFRDALEEAAMFSVVATLNNVGIGNKAVGPITSASGDGMAKIQNYFSGSANYAALASAEDIYLGKIRDIKQMYSALGLKSNYSPPAQVFNEYLDHDYNINDQDERMLDGNDEQ